MIPKRPGIAKKMIPKNPGIAQKGTQKSGSNPPKSTQNNGTSPYHDICKLTWWTLLTGHFFQIWQRK